MPRIVEGDPNYTHRLQPGKSNGVNPYNNETTKSCGPSEQLGLRKENPNIVRLSVLVAATQGDKNAFMQIYARYHTNVVNYFRTKVPQDYAEDYDQTTWKKLYATFYGKEQPFQPKGVNPLKKYLFKIAGSLCQLHIREEKQERKKMRQLQTRMIARTTESNTYADPEARFLHIELLQAVRDAIGKLPPRQQAIIRARFGNELQIPEIAAKSGMSVIATKALLHRSITALREQLAEYQDK